jgi:hypothetical protein
MFEFVSTVGSQVVVDESILDDKFEIALLARFATTIME